MSKLTKTNVDALAATGEERFVWDAEVKGFGVRVKPTGSKSFVLKYRIGKATRRFTISKVGSPFTVDQARDRAKALLRGLADGVDPAQAKTDEREAVTVADLMDAYLADGAALKPNKKASSWTTDAIMVNRHIKPLLGRKPAKSITAADVARFQIDVSLGKTAMDVKTGPRGRARVTGGKRVAALSTAVLGAGFQFGIDTRRVTENPARGVPLLKTNKRERFLSAREVSFIAEAMTALESEGEINGTMADAARLLMLTGCRKTEILSLQWPWVDFEHTCLRLPDSKTGAKVVHLGAPAMAILERRRSAYAAAAARAHAARSPRTPAEPYVLPAARGVGYMVGLPRAWSMIKARAMTIAQAQAEKAGEDPALVADLTTVRLHDLRHSFVSFAVADGAALFLVGKIVGHRQARTTEGYAHLSADPLKSVAERTAGRIADAMRTGEPSPR